MKYPAILFLYLLFAAGVLNAQDSVIVEIPNVYADDENASEPSYNPVNPGEVAKKTGHDSEPIRVQRFDRKKWEEIIGTNDYSEESPATKPKQKAYDSTHRESSNSNKRFEARDYEEGHSDADSPASSPINSPVLKVIFYTVTLAIIAYMLFLIIKNTSLKTNRKRNPNADGPDHTSVEDIKELEIDRLLREAMTSGNYRLAVRIYFLGMLKKLDEDGFIVWKKDKTNRDYLSELFSKEHYFEEVKRLTLAYEQVWYGDHDLPVQTYEQIISSFKAIDQKLNVSKPQ